MNSVGRALTRKAGPLTSPKRNTKKKSMDVAIDTQQCVFGITQMPVFIMKLHSVGSERLQL